jgi:hypothetical protein
MVDAHEMHEVPGRFSDHKLYLLSSDLAAYKLEQEQRWERLERIVEANTRSVEHLADSVKIQAESTAGIVQLCSDVQAAARLGTKVRICVTRVLGAGAVGVIALAIVDKVLDYITTLFT